MNNDIFREKLLNGTFNEEELKLISFCDVEADVKEVDRQEGENRRWTRTVSTIFEFEGNFYSLDWEEGLTESQENEYFCQPYEVEKQVEMVEEINWIKKNDDLKGAENEQF